MKRAMVTGVGRGIGAEVAGRLAGAGYEVVGTTRRPGALWPLELTDPESIAALAARIDRLDVLVDNAAIALEGFGAQIVKSTMATNVRGTIALTEALADRVGRVVIVSSGMGELSAFSGSAREALSQEHDLAGVLALVDRFEDAVAKNELKAQGWPRSAYSVSKGLVNAYVRHLARRGIEAVAVCPGWVRTDMGGEAAPRSIAEGGKGIVWAATQPIHSGRFYRDGRPIPW